MPVAAPGKLDNKVSPKHPITLPTDNLPLQELCAVLHDKVTAFLRSDPPNELLKDVQLQADIALGVLAEALDNFNALALSYNGGKDCLVLLILWLVTLHKHYSRPRNEASMLAKDTTPECGLSPFPRSIDSVYVRSRNAFEEVDDFVQYSARQYHLNLTTYEESIKVAFGKYIEKNPNVEAIFVGTRRADPHGGSLPHFAQTDGDWPRFMRCHPVIDWQYREIWAFIRHFEIPYCRLYDLGYTSLGGTTDTQPNPKLRVEADGPGNACYRPAYELMEDEEERLGRFPSQEQT